MFFFMTRVRPLSNVQTYVDELSAKFPATNIYLSGNKKVLGGINYPENVKLLDSPDAFEQVIANSLWVPRFKINI